MKDSLDPLSDRACRMTHAYNTGIKLRETLRDGVCLRAAASEVTIPSIRQNAPERGEVV
jgi:hypothetical protein